MEILDLKIFYFDKEYFFESYNRWKEGKANIPGQHISPLELSWNHFFKPKVVECEILERFELKTVSNKVLNNHSIYVLQDDFLWLECIPSYDGNKFFNIDGTNLFSVSSLKEASETYKSVFKDKYKNNFGEDWMLDKVFTILNRQNKLKELGI
jgi:hypothetical protein